MRVDIYLEAGTKRVVAGAIEWPGLCRIARDADAALAAVVEYAPRYARALGARAAAGFTIPSAAELDVVQRFKGDATTDFGAPSRPPRADARPLDAAELKRQIALLKACWAAFDSAARAHARSTLRTGPRGGGRDVPKMRSHVMGADKAYLARLGGSARGLNSDEQRVRDAVVEAIVARAHGEPLERSRSNVWFPRFGVRRSAWHALDHAWEIEDRAR